MTSEAGETRERTRERTLVGAVCEGNPRAAEELLLITCGRTIQYLAHRYRYDDLLGDLYAHLQDGEWRRLRTWTGQSSIRRWVEQVAVRLCLARLHERARDDCRRHSGPDLDESLVAQSDGMLLQGLAASELSTAITRLDSARDRQVLCMRYLEEEDFDTIASALGTSRENVYLIKQRALKRLRRVLGDDYGCL